MPKYNCLYTRKLRKYPMIPKLCGGKFVELHFFAYWKPEIRLNNFFLNLLLMNNYNKNMVLSRRMVRWFE